MQSCPRLGLARVPKDNFKIQNMAICRLHLLSEILTYVNNLLMSRYIREHIVAPDNALLKR